MGLIENMQFAVESNGGRMTEEEYLKEVLRIIESEGGSTNIASLKSNAFNTKRMEAAGITRLTIGKDKYVWTTSMVESMMSGNAVAMPTTTLVNNVNAPEPTDDGYFYGIRRRSEEYREHLRASLSLVGL